MKKLYISILKKLAKMASEILDEGDIFECSPHSTALPQLKGGIIVSAFGSEKQVKLFVITPGGIKKFTVHTTIDLDCSISPYIPKEKEAE